MKENIRRKQQQKILTHHKERKHILQTCSNWFKRFGSEYYKTNCRLKCEAASSADNYMLLIYFLQYECLYCANVNMFGADKGKENNISMSRCIYVSSPSKTNFFWQIVCFSIFKEKKCFFYSLMFWIKIMS